MLTAASRGGTCSNRTPPEKDAPPASFSECVRYATHGVDELDDIRFLLTANVEEFMRDFCSYKAIPGMAGGGRGGRLHGFTATFVLTDRALGRVLAEKTFRSKREKCPGSVFEDDLDSPWTGAGKESLDAKAIGAWLTKALGDRAQANDQRFD